MFRKLPVILNAEDLIDRSFRKSKKIQITDRNALFKKKKTIIARTDSFTTSVIVTLENYVKKFPSIDNLPMFYQEIIDIYVKKFPSIDNLPMFYQEIIDIKIDTNKLKKSLGAVDWARKTCQMIYSKQVKSLRKSKNIDFLMKKQQEIYGRITSVVKQIDNELINLGKAIAGYPNVGKSSLLRCISKAKPQIAQYPFTTKEIHVGHLERKDKYILKRYQVIDTPGLLDRPLSKRNDIEKQAIAALSHLADVIVFIMDTSETCGYSLDDQKHLLTQMKKMFKDSQFIIVENKADFKKTRSKNFKISCETGEGIDLLVKELFSLYKSEET